MSAVVADTHAVLWYLLSPDKLSPKAEAALDEAQNVNAPIYVATISLAEVVYLTEKGRLAEAAYQRLNLELSQPEGGFVVVPLDLPIVQTLRRIPRDVVPDMPDQIIAATALYLNLPLVTRDSDIRAANLTTIW